MLAVYKQNISFLKSLLPLLSLLTISNLLRFYPPIVHKQGY